MFTELGRGGFFAPDATVTVTLVTPAPEVILGDCDQNGVVDFSDIGAFVGVLSSGTFLAQADCDQDGELTFADIPPFVAILLSAN